MVRLLKDQGTVDLIDSGSDWGSRGPLGVVEVWSTEGPLVQCVSWSVLWFFILIAYLIAYIIASS